MRYLVKRIPSTSLVQYDGSRYYCEIAGGTAEKSTVDTTGLLAGSKYLDVQTGTWYVYDELTNAWAVSAEGGSADPAVVEAAVEAWLDAHPEATTTVQDGSITYAKLDTTLKGKADAVATLSDEIARFEQIDYSTTPGYLNINGDVATDNNTVNLAVTTEYIPVQNGYKFKCSFAYSEARALWAAFCMYDAAKNKIGSRSVFANTTTQSGTYTITVNNANAEYVRISYRTFGDITAIISSADVSGIVQESIHNINQLNDAQRTFVNTNIADISHRGAKNCPENTITAFKAARNLGYLYAETDTRTTSDGVVVLLHDATINRTARNADGTDISETINISDITYEQALTYDFGIYKGAQFAGTKIPTLKEFLTLCRKIGLIPVIEPKDAGALTESISIVKNMGLAKVAYWTTALTETAQTITTAIPNAPIALITTGALQDTTYETLKSLTDKPIISLSTETPNRKTVIETAISKGCDVWIWTIVNFVQFNSLENDLVSGYVCELVDDIPSHYLFMKNRY